MYVKDMTLEDAQMFLAEYQAEVASLEAHGFIPHEQLVWDIEDLEGRIADLTYEPPCREGNHPFCCDPTRP